MSLKNVSLILSLAMIGVVEAQWTDWLNQYPYDGHRVYSHTMHRTADGNLLLCASIHGGWTPGGGFPFEDYAIATYLLKIQPTGDTLWTQRIDSLKPWNITHVVDLIDGNTLITGTAQGPVTYCGMAITALPMAQLFAMKIDQQGNVLWWHQYDQPCERILVDAWETPAQEIHLLAMNTQQPNISIGYFPPTWFEDQALDAQGNTLSMTMIQQADPFLFNNAGGPAHGPGRYLLTTSLDTVGQNSTYIQLGRLDESGTPLWFAPVTDTLLKAPKRIVPTPDDGLLMLMNYDHSSSRVLHTDTLGNILWDKTFATRMVDVIALPDTTYLVVGTHTISPAFTDRELCVTHLSTAGDSLWSRFYGDSLTDIGSSIVHTPNGFVVYGTKDLYSGSVPPRLFINSDSLSMLPLVVDVTPHDGLGISAYPNPASATVTVEFSNLQAAPQELDLHDALGRVIRRFPVSIRNAQTNINVQDLPAGCYVLVATTTSGRASARIMLQH